MRVVTLASSVIHPDGWNLMNELKFDPFSNGDDWVTDADIIGEFAGRACYESYPRPNPKTGTNAAYLKNTVCELVHESILEHSTATFYVSGVSRNLLLELERHRHLSFSVISTRYVSPVNMGIALHPNTPLEFRERLMKHDLQGRYLSNDLFNHLKEKEGFGNKEAREVARQHLGGNTETKFVVTGNLRAWRYVINLRAHPKADAEIQQFAGAVLYELKNKIAPNSFQDF